MNIWKKLKVLFFENDDEINGWSNASKYDQIKATTINGLETTENMFIPFISAYYQFTIKRIQYPIKTTSTMSINTSQGLSLKVAGWFGRLMTCQPSRVIQIQTILLEKG